MVVKTLRRSKIQILYAPLFYTNINAYKITNNIFRKYISDRILIANIRVFQEVHEKLIL